MSFRTVIEQLPRVEVEWLRPLDPGSYRLTVFMLLRLLGLIYTLAFLSLSNQLSPLISADGLLPAALFLEKTARYFGDSASVWTRMPTLFWLDASDATMQALAHLGSLLSILLLCGITNVFQLFVLWLIYLSFNSVG